ncbi:unnamed protein product [Symbiodinium sp. CCMP2456]|nr:unnamed protein product [Symbiodinium sp. CCMP2456]
MANKVEANIASTEEGSSSSSGTDASVLQPVLSLLEGVTQRLEDFERRLEKVDDSNCRIEAMANKVEANIASTEEAWAARCEQLQAANIVAFQRIEKIDAQLALLLERPGASVAVHCPRGSHCQAAVQTDSEEKDLRETVEKQELQLQLAAGDKQILKDEYEEFRRIAFDAIAEKNGYKADLRAAQRHIRLIGFLKEVQENQDPGQASEAMPEDCPQQDQQEPQRPQRASGPGGLWLYREEEKKHLMRLREAEREEEHRLLEEVHRPAGEDLVVAYKAHFGKRPKPDQLKNWVNNSRGQAISWAEAKRLIASSTMQAKQAKQAKRAK